MVTGTFTSAGVMRGATLVAGKTPLMTRIQGMAKEARSAFRTTPRRRTLKEIAMAPAGDSAFSIGKGVLAGGSAFGLGALCYYGLGMSKEEGAIDRAMIWPEYVKERIQTTYLYLAGSLGITAGSAAAVFRSPRMLTLVSANGWVAIIGSLAAVIGSGMIVRSIEYRPGFGAKQMAWMAHSAILGAVVAPMCFLGGPLLLRAAWYTAGVVGGLSMVAACAPSEKFLTMGGPLAIGLGVVFMSSLGGMFLPPTTALGAGLYSISLYGGLVLFGGFLLYDTQKIIRKAESYPLYGVRPFDPVNASVSIYLDTLNIFIRIATILAGGGNRRK